LTLDSSLLLSNPSSFLPAMCVQGAVRQKGPQWYQQMDLPKFAGEIRALEKELRDQAGPEDARHLQKILDWAVFARIAGLALAGVCKPMQGNVLAALALSTATFARWTMVGHHVGHGGYDKNPDCSERFRRRRFGLGPVRRVLDWLDWMMPEAWDVEHNHLHHYELGEEGDPDLVQRNMDSIRSGEFGPMPIRYVVVFFLMSTWKWFYYAPNTLKELDAAKAKRAKTAPMFGSGPLTVYELIGSALKGNVYPILMLAQCLAPYALWQFVAIPAMFHFIGGETMARTAFHNVVLAELFTNLHSFAVIASNHCGRDVYRFDTHVLPKSDDFIIHQIVGSVNFDLGNDALDFVHGWLNYQIEHHIWPDMSMLQYQRAAPRVEAICKKHGVPYNKQNVAVRVWRTIQIMVGNESMLCFERGDTI